MKLKSCKPIFKQYNVTIIKDQQDMIRSNTVKTGPVVTMLRTYDVPSFLPNIRKIINNPNFIS